MVDTWDSWQSASDPWQGHDVGGLLVALFAGATTLMALTVYLFSRLAPQNLQRYTPTRALRDVPLLALAVATALYLWGLLLVLLTEDQEQAQECELRRPGDVPSLVGRRGDFFPLRVVCEGSNGHDYNVVVPDYITPAHAALLTVALLCAAGSAVLHRRRLVAADGAPGPVSR
ncbi:hypothetical protein OG259_18130 [Streptomyces sp. NBC_00250]|uniref:hypothetical protein n=1 Tax=Streptomyces sp. NBC_00250 TaxID=2903641 RepID=UPI002E282539|nr:hypothetical protein [Streptomyces sp. NBC_00250]